MTLMAFLGIFSLPICANWLFLANKGELLPIEEIVQKQLSAKQYCLVGLATRNQGYYYKKAMYQQIKPKILIHGSSRVMQFKSDYFTGEMFNSGGAMASVNEGFSFLQAAVNVHKPQLILLGIDYWWFNKNLIEPTTSIKPPLPLSHQISLRSYLLPYRWLWQKKISLAEYLNGLNPFASLNEHSIGIDGHLKQTGFAPDGSYFYTKTLVGQEKSNDEGFHHSAALVAARAPGHELAVGVDETHFDNFLAMLRFIEANNIKVILFIPPVAPTFGKKIPNLLILNELRQKLAAANIAFYDFHDHPVLNSSDCEFIDATHGGDLLYARLLQYMAQREPQLQRFTDSAKLAAVTTRYRNLAMVPNQKITTAPEVDFLKLGCDKVSQFS